MPMRIFKAACFPLAVLCILTAGASVVVPPQLKAHEAKPGVFIQTLGNRAIEILSASNHSMEEQEDRFREILRDDFAIEEIGRFVAGKYWREMTADQKRDYQKLFDEWVLKTFSIRLGGYSGETLRVINTTNTSKRDVIVHTRIAKAEGGGINTNWRVREVDGRYKIIDVYVEGVSMAVTQRSEFGAVLQRHGADGLIGLLRTRLSDISAAR
jgi:phospholipid transport system substrate-binding protein